MRTQVWVYVAVAALSLVAAVAIAGLPSSEAREPTIEPPASTEASTTTVAVPATEPAAEETTPEVTEAPTTTTTTSTTTSTVPIVDRADVVVVVANGADVGGAATRTSGVLEEAGYIDVRTFDGEEIVEATIVFADDSVGAEAARLASDLGIDEGLTLPLETAPAVPGLPDSVQLLVYLGRDVESLSFFA